MRKTLHILYKLYVGQTLARIHMNLAFANHSLRGEVLDVGGGRNPDYFSYFQKEHMTSLRSIDGSSHQIDFETDPLPFADKSIDTVILSNVLEHIYNHSFLVAEIKRILTQKGRVVGFVPFWVGYHADPHDYFRYTNEALVRIFGDAGFTHISITACEVGPFLANFNTIVLSLPRVIRPLMYLLYWIPNRLFKTFRPRSFARNPLGYVFNVNSYE